MTALLKGVLVYATGKTETIDDPAGCAIIKRCGHCGGELLFESSPTMAEDEATVVPGSEADERRRRVEKIRGRPLDGTNQGAIVYIQRPNRRAKTMPG